MGKILVIEDEAMVLRMIKEVLTRFGFTVDVAHTGSEGLHKFDNDSYDLVITDILMPGIDGNRIASHIRGSARGATPIIGMSGTPWLFKDNNFNKILPKPFPIKTLMQNVSELTTE
ncbi:MAG: response regulator [Thermodesulfobacteriota bacterium]